MKKIVYFITPLPNGGVIFQNGFLDEEFKCNKRLSNITNGLLDSQSHPDFRGSLGFYLQGMDKHLDLKFYSSRYDKLENLRNAIITIDKINNGDIDV